MSIERDASRILHELEHSRVDPWGTHAKNMADGIDRSGVPALLGQVADRVASVEGAVKASSYEVTSSVAALAAVNASGFKEVCGALAKQTAVLSQIEALLANPLSTAAAERYRRGVQALHEGWYDDAIRELDASIEQDPFQPLTHYSRGLALGASEHADDAYHAFMSAVKYCGSTLSLASVAAGAALLAAQTGAAMGRPESVGAAIDAGLDRAPGCAELRLAHARHFGSDESLRAALLLAPELSLPAVAAGVKRADVIANIVHDDPEGPIAAARSATKRARALGFELAWPDEVPDAMTFHRTWRDSYAEQLAAAAAAAVIELQNAERVSADAGQAMARHTVVEKKARFLWPLVFIASAGLVLVTVFSSMLSVSNAGADPPVWQALLGGSALLAIIAGVLWLVSAIKIQASDTKARNRGMVSLTRLLSAAAQAERSLEDARQREAAALSVTRALLRACPERIFPLTAPRG